MDLVAILPFWLGFLPALKSDLRLVRTLRALRMLKFYRYSRDLQVMALGFYRAWFNLRPLLMTALVVMLFTMFALYEIEGPTHTEFQSLFNVGWFLQVTGTTVGYGDLSPQTTAGRIIVMLFMVAGLAIFMACFSAITSAFDEVFERARDPAFDPLAHFRLVHREWVELQKSVGEVGTTTAEDVAAEGYAEELAAEEHETEEHDDGNVETADSKVPETIHH